MLARRDRAKEFSLLGIANAMPPKGVKRKSAVPTPVQSSTPQPPSLVESLSVQNKFSGLNERGRNSRAKRSNLKRWMWIGWRIPKPRHSRQLRLLHQYFHKSDTVISPGWRGHTQIPHQAYATTTEYLRTNQILEPSLYASISLSPYTHSVVK
ncbi:hypothetical protein RhiJN_12356 [Ceratobasidium sp. AG-Ba]|nr:hypothetical protein RhiJN_12356 [Ceratobasidium sp. AG-Ba]